MSMSPSFNIVGRVFNLPVHLRHSSTREPVTPRYAGSRGVDAANLPHHLQKVPVPICWLDGEGLMRAMSSVTVVDFVWSY